MFQNNLLESDDAELDFESENDAQSEASEVRTRNGSFTVGQGKFDSLTDGRVLVRERQRFDSVRYKYVPYVVSIDGRAAGSFFMEYETGRPVDVRAFVDEATVKDAIDYFTQVHFTTYPPLPPGMRQSQIIDNKDALQNSPQ